MSLCKLLAWTHKGPGGNRPSNLSIVFFTAAAFAMPLNASSSSRHTLVGAQRWFLTQFNRYEAASSIEAPGIKNRGQVIWLSWKLQCETSIVSS